MVLHYASQAIIETCRMVHYVFWSQPVENLSRICSDSCLDDGCHSPCPMVNHTKAECKNTKDFACTTDHVSSPKTCPPSCKPGSNEINSLRCPPKCPKSSHLSNREPKNKRSHSVSRKKNDNHKLCQDDPYPSISLPKNNPKPVSTLRQENFPTVFKSKEQFISDDNVPQMKGNESSCYSCICPDEEETVNDLTPSSQDCHEDVPRKPRTGFTVTCCSHPSDPIIQSKDIIGENDFLNIVAEEECRHFQVGTNSLANSFEDCGQESCPSSQATPCISSSTIKVTERPSQTCIRRRPTHNIFSISGCRNSRVPFAPCSKTFLSPSKVEYLTCPFSWDPMKACVIFIVFILILQLLFLWYYCCKLEEMRHSPSTDPSKFISVNTTEDGQPQCINDFDNMKMRNMDCSSNYYYGCESSDLTNTGRDCDPYNKKGYYA